MTADGGVGSVQVAGEHRAFGRFALGSETPRQPVLGASYEAIDPTSRTLAVVTAVSSGGDPGFADRFLADVDLLSRADNQALPQVLDRGITDDGGWVATSPIEGISLQEMIASSGPLFSLRAIRLLGDIADALESAHRAGLVHGGVSPAVVVVRQVPIERPVLEGFALGSDPESVGGAAPTPASDQLALAWLLVEALTGSGPGIDGSSEALPAGLEPMFAAALAADPAQRPTSRELLSETARVLVSGEAPAEAATPHPPRSRSRAPGRRRRGRLLGALGPAVSRRGRSRSHHSPAQPAQPVGPSGEVTDDERGAARERRAHERAARRQAARNGEALSAAPEAQLAAAERARKRRPALIALTLVFVVAAGGAGFATGRSTEEKPAAPGKATASSGPLSVDVPASWERGNDAPRAGPRLRDPISARSGAGRLAAGMVDSPGGLLFPRRIAGRALTRPSAPEAVRLGRLQAWRFRGGSRSGQGRATVFLAPTSGGMVVLSCAAPASAASGFLPACERASATLSTGDELRPVALSSLDAYAARANRVIRRLASTRGRDRRLLRRAELRRGQARVARRLARADRVAAAGLTRGVPAAARNEIADLRGALRRAGDGYSALARASAGSNRRGYRAASRRIRSAEAAVARAVARL